MHSSRSLICQFIGLLASTSSASEPANFQVPFEIGFQDTNQFNFSVFHLDSFLAVSSNLFQVEQDNISITFVQEQTDISTDTINIDVGFVVTVNTWAEEALIRGFDEDAYRDQLEAAENMPSVIKISIKHNDSCPDAMYATFYHFEMKCQWLCDHLSVYNNASNECEPTADMVSIVYKDARLKYAGYGGGAGVAVSVLALVIYVIRWSDIDIRKTEKARESREKVQSGTECELQKTRKPEITSNAVLEHGDHDDDHDDALSADQIAFSVRESPSQEIKMVDNELTCS